MTLPVTRTLTLSLKNTIPTLALLVAIFMLSGCVGKTLNDIANRLQGDVEGALVDLEKGITGNINGINDLPEGDLCKTPSVLFGNSGVCGERYDLTRENQCTIQFDAALCGDTVTRVCTANARRQLCHGIEPYETTRMKDLAIVSASDWTTSLTTDDATLDRTPTAGGNENLFLEGLTLAALKQYTITSTFTDGFKSNDGTDTKRRDETIFTITSADTGTRGQNRSIGTLTLAHTQLINPVPNVSPIFHGFKEPGATATDPASTGDENDGVSFVAGQFNRRFGECLGSKCNINRYYAGVHATTDLGAPITDDDQVSQWRGLLRTVGLGNLTSVPFEIDITFNRANSGGTIKANFNSAGPYVIDATYDSFGAITGSIMAHNSPGKVSGIIGQEGLVAAFISNFTGVVLNPDTDPVGYAGGFVAYLPNPTPPEPCLTNRSCVDYTHWVTAADPATTPTANKFLTGTAGGLTTGHSFVGKSTTLASSNTARNLKAEDTMDGFAIFYDGTTHNAGLLSTTRVGAPWRNNGVNLEWEGQFVERVGEANDVRLSNLTLIVNFSGSSGTIAATNVGFSNAYSFTADFDNYGLITNGVITRTVTTPTADTSTGIVTGLVGVGLGLRGAAVGVFHSNADESTSYVGGFVASGENPKTTPGS